MRAFLEGTRSKIVLKVGVIDGAVLEQSKNIAPERHRITKYRYLHQVRAKVNASADPPDPADPDYPPDQVSETAARTLPSTRAGGQDDGS